MTLEDQLCFKLYALSRQMTGLYRPLLDKLDITYPQYLVLLILWEGKSITVKALGERLFLDSGTLTPLLKRLEQKALLVRRRDTADERSVIIELTPKGAALQQQSNCIPAELNETLQLNEKSYTKLKASLDQLLAKLK